MVQETQTSYILQRWGCSFSDPSEAFTSSVFEPNFLGLGFFEKLQMLCGVIRPVVKLISKSTIKTPLKDIFIRTLYMGSSKNPAIDFCSEVLSPLSYYATFLTDFQKPQTVCCLQFQPGFYATHLISSGHILLLSLSTVQGEPS